jgi:hypothetical protein
MKYALSLFFAVMSCSLLAQRGQVTIIKDDRIEQLIKSKSQIIPPATSPQIPGFRVQLIFDSNKKVIDDARAKFINSNPKIDTYINYNAPNFILKVGDFRTKLEADRLKDAMMREFPTCFVVKEMINLPRID